MKQKKKKLETDGKTEEEIKQMEHEQAKRNYTSQNCQGGTNKTKNSKSRKNNSNSS